MTAAPLLVYSRKTDWLRQAEADIALLSNFQGSGGWDGKSNVEVLVAKMGSIEYDASLLFLFGCAGNLASFRIFDHGFVFRVHFFDWGPVAWPLRSSTV